MPETHNFNRWIAGTLFMTSLFLVGAIFAIATDRTLIEDQKDGNAGSYYVGIECDHCLGL